MALSERHQAILEARGLDAEQLAKHGVESSDKLGTDCVVIPFVEAGRIVNRKYRTIAGEKRFAQDAGARKVFWNVDVLSDATLADQPLIITEGEFDAIAAIQAGFVRTVSVPDGAPAEELGEGATAKYSYLDNAPLALASVKEIILATDGDGPGTNLLHDLALRLGKARCKWIKYPQKCKDLNDALRLYGAKGVSAALATAQWVKVDGLYRMGELPPLPERKSHRMDMPVLDDHYRLRLGDMTVITGIPSHGKSSFINEVCGRMATKWNWPAVFGSFEQEPQTDHRRALRTWFNRKREFEQTDDEKHEADVWIDRMFSFIVPSEDDDITLDWVLERCSAGVVRNGAKIVVIDPWNEMDHIRPPDMTITEYTGFAIKQFRKFARKHLIHLIVAAHPTKQRKLESGDYAMPTLYDISDSAHWYNKADVGIVVHRTMEGTTIRVAKSRYHELIGEPGDVKVAFNKLTGRYEIADTANSLAA